MASDHIAVRAPSSRRSSMIGVSEEFDQAPVTALLSNLVVGLECLELVFDPGTRSSWLPYCGRLQIHL